MIGNFFPASQPYKAQFGFPFLSSLLPLKSLAALWENIVSLNNVFSRRWLAVCVKVGSHHYLPI
jgi:hypothetical protein